MKVAVATALVTACFSVAANAQRMPVGERTSPAVTPNFPLKEGVKAGAQDMRRVMQVFALCVAKNNERKVHSFLQSTDQSFRKILGSRAVDCLTDTAGYESRMSGDPMAFRYALAEVMVLKKYGAAGMSDLDQVPTVSADKTHPHAIGPLGECIVRKSPRESWLLLTTDAASEDEKAAFGALSPAMTSCVTNATTVKMPAFYLRGAVANAYYHLSEAPKTAAGAPN